ncbi:uncharacterized protein [Palaemon carinicauda]|uniref:uncharacterized protein n=1 Tax=Palaemon carinicauda TaxID=392227 RepID=UPI0035B67C10
MLKKSGLLRDSQVLSYSQLSCNSCSLLNQFTLCLPITSRPKRSCASRATTEVVRQVAAAVARPRTRRRAAAAVVAAAVVLAARRAGERGITSPYSGNSDNTINSLRDINSHTGNDPYPTSLSDNSTVLVTGDGPNTNNISLTPTSDLGQEVTLDREKEKDGIDIPSEEDEEEMTFMKDLLVL